MDKFVEFIKEIKKEFMELKRQYQIYFFLQKHYLRNRMLNSEK